MSRSENQAVVKYFVIFQVVMEATREVEGLLDKIRPPRLEDAGLEDPALPPDAIKEAFLKAASTVGSRATSIFSRSEDYDDEDEEGHCMNNPWPTAGDLSDALVGIREGIDPPPGACAAENGGRVPEVMGDQVVAGVTGVEEMVDKVVVAGPDVPEGGGKACVEGLQGLRIGDKGDEKNEEDEEEKEGKRPTLAETYV